MEEIWQKIINYFQTTGITIAKTITLVVLGILGIKILMKLLRKLTLKSSVENSIAVFLLSILNVVLYVGLFFSVCMMLNISTTGIIATMSTLVLAIALSLQESLKNIASGVIIIVTKPFKEGDLVDVNNNVQGKILEINMFQTKLITFDNKLIAVPNSQIVNSNIINSTATSTRRIDLQFGVSYSSNIRNVKSVIFNTISRHQKIFKTPSPIIRLAKHDESALIFDVKVWVLTDDYYEVTYDINEMIFEAFARNQIEIPYNQMDVHIKNEDVLNSIKLKQNSMEFENSKVITDVENKNIIDPIKVKEDPIKVVKPIISKKDPEPTKSKEVGNKKDVVVIDTPLVKKSTSKLTKAVEKEPIKKAPATKKANPSIKVEEVKSNIRTKKTVKK